MTEVFKPQGKPAKAALGDDYQQSINDPEKYWAEKAERLSWHKKWHKVKNTGFENEVSIRWFEGGELNVAYNCIDRHLDKNADKVAIIWESDDCIETKHITFKQLHVEVCKLANALTNLGVKKGDRVTIYLPMVPEAAYSMLACARIGAIHSVVFGGFSPDALAGRIDDCESDFIITADEGLRGCKKIPLKDNVDAALKIAKHKLKKVLVVKRTGGKIAWDDDRDLWYHEELKKASAQHIASSFESETPLFILYTSGSTGKPKGVVHTTAGYLLYAAITHEYAFGVQQNDIYWCTADIGWITGHSYIIYGPLANGTTTLMFEGIPTYPDASRFWQVVDKHKVNIFYTAPTAIRSLMAAGDEFVSKTSRKTLRVLGTVGEPINPEAWLWYYNIIGEKHCPVIDTWWQTETGGFMITPLAGISEMKPGLAGKPFFGIDVVLLNEKQQEQVGKGEGALCIKSSWPGQARTIYGDHQRFIETYFKSYPGYYFSGDGARRDDDGFYQITGRTDDVIKVSGHRIGTAEVESALASHPKVAEAAVVATPHEIKGQAIYAYVVLNSGNGDTDLEKELIKHVKNQIAPIAAPEYIHITRALPKTRSGKIMRRILRKIAGGSYEDLGDTSTLLNPEIVDELISQNKKITK